ncbi:MAG TPA: PAS domain S-box protein, partial [Acidimicrobiales bacterium]
MVERTGQETAVPGGAASDVHHRASLGRWLLKLSPTALGYLMGPVSLVIVLLLTHFGVLLYEPTWLWIAVFAAIPLTSALVDRLYQLRPSRLRLHLLVVQNVTAATTVIYLSGWGPVMVLAFAFVALGNIARDGSRAWRIAALWSVVGICVGQATIWLDWAPSVLSDSRAQVLGFLGAFVLFFVIRLAGAVMQKKEEADESVSQSEARLRRTIDTANEAYLEFDVRCVVTEWNEQAARTFGWSRQEALGRQLRELVVVPSLRAGFTWDSVHRVAAADPGNIRAQVESVALHRDGHEFPVQVSLWQTDTPEGSRFNAFIQDITERTKATEDLQRSQESFRLLFERHPHPMWVYDFETLAFLEVNQCAIENYGYTREEFLSMSITDIRPGEEIPRLLAYQELMRSDLTHAGVWIHRLKSGELISVEIAAHTLEFNGHSSALVMAQDVTERCRLEQRLR